MGTWGFKSFDNDTAMDWVYDLEESEDDELIKECLLDLLNSSDEYLDAEVCCCAVASAEVVAAYKGNPMVELPDEVSEWLSNNSLNDIEDLSEMSEKALNMILKKSELQELWAESEDQENWEKDIKDLIKRIS